MNLIVPGSGVSRHLLEDKINLEGVPEDLRHDRKSGSIKQFHKATRLVFRVLLRESLGRHSK